MDNRRIGGRHSFRRGLIRLLTLWLATTALATGAESELEAKVKAAYLYHLTRFVDWPALPSDAMRICVLGSEPIGDMLGELSNRSVHDRPLKVIVESIGNPANCQLLFIGRADRRLPEMLARVRGLAVLTVSDKEDFARSGGIVGFYSDAGKIKLEINPEAARHANLRLSAKLLELARTVPANE